MPDPFPNELVEAAAVVCYSLAPEHDTSTYPHGYVPYDEARPSSRENARADALEVLTALYPLIEQRARLDERERLSSRVHENGWCPTCARDTDEAAMQRVIDRLAREAGEGDLGEDLCDAFAHHSMPLWERAQITDAVHAVAARWVACGVAAERARCPLCDHEWRRHDPEDGRCDCHSETIIGPCQCGRDLAWMQERIAAMSCAALAPERTTGEDE